MNIIIADDHTLFREMCKEYVARKRPDINILTAKDYNDAIILLEKESDIDLIILDLCMPGMDGTKGITEIINNYSGILVTIISGVAKEEDVEACIEAGAKGFFPKSMSGQSLISAIDLVMSGEVFIPANYQNPPELDHAPNIKDITQKGIHLTKRELEVLSLLVKGASNQDIVDSLGIKLVTVKLHVKSCCRKLNAKNRTHAAILAKELGI